MKNSEIDNEYTFGGFGNPLKHQQLKKFRKTERRTSILINIDKERLILKQVSYGIDQDEEKEGIIENTYQ